MEDVKTISYFDKFYHMISHNIKPMTISDRTCFKKISRYIAGLIESEAISEQEAVSRVKDYLRESISPGVRNPAAVFVSIMKKELYYEPNPKAAAE